MLQGTIRPDAPDGVAVVADVGRNAVRIALTDAEGQLRRDTVRRYDAAQQTTVSGTITSFGREMGLRTLPRRCAISVSGLARGNTISITHSRWIISRTGLQAMLQTTPLILNDMAASAWSLTVPRQASLDVVHGIAPDPAHRPGTYCLIGIGSGLGVAALARDEVGAVTVLATEAGHSEFMPATGGNEAIWEEFRKLIPCAYAERVLSAPGLLKLYQAIASSRGQTAQAEQPTDVARLAAAGLDSAAACATKLFAQAFWQFAGNMALTYGAWDGVLITGRIAQLLRSALKAREAREHFIIEGPYARLLRDVPAALVGSDQGELVGVAEALKRRDLTAAAAAYPL